MGHLVTIDLPDELYEKFKARSQRTNRSIEEELLTSFALDLPLLPMLETQTLQAYEEVLDFLTSAPSRSEILRFQLSDSARQRAKFLLEKEKAQGLTSSEASELDFYVELGDFLGILRAKAQQHEHQNRSGIEMTS
jgi:hypothetical protein